MKKINLLTIIGVSALALLLFLLTFIKTESKPLAKQHSQMEKGASTSHEIGAKKSIMPFHESNSTKVPGQKVKSCCAGASRYMQLKK
ncbi:MAG: hypothetical protein ACYCZO_16035 [Daejeonella sp.]